jgi:cytochrome b subunit of formate dehydrogenase
MMTGDRSYVRRLAPYHRVLHVFVQLSFFGLVATGMPLKYSDAPWASWIMKLWGGYQNAGFVHRVCASVTFGYFMAHIFFVAYYIGVVKKFGFNPFGPDSMVPRPKDLRDIYGSFRWFLGLSPRPRFDRWTYWEKFDYWAVFWGVAVIGGSGLLLWFKAFFGQFLPGYFFNIAAIVHGEEALLAASFIFTVHFFNTHLRPEKFPMDMVMFTGRLSLEEFQKERPLEYERLKKNNDLEECRAESPPGWLLCISMPYGVFLILLGLFLLVLILLGQFAY